LIPSGTQPSPPGAVTSRSPARHLGRHRSHTREATGGVGPGTRTHPNPRTPGPRITIMGLFLGNSTTSSAARAAPIPKAPNKPKPRTQRAEQTQAQDPARRTNPSRLLGHRAERTRAAAATGFPHCSEQTQNASYVRPGIASFARRARTGASTRRTNPSRLPGQRAEQTQAQGPARRMNPSPGPGAPNEPEPG
jgi:hypothetical protein